MITLGCIRVSLRAHCALCTVQGPKDKVMQVHTHPCQLLAAMNVYETVSPIILQGISRGTMCIQGHSLYTLR